MVGKTVICIQENEIIEMTFVQQKNKQSKSKTENIES